MESERSDFKAIANDGSGAENEERERGQERKCKEEIVLRAKSGVISKTTVKIMKEPVFGHGALVASVKG